MSVNPKPTATPTRLSRLSLKNALRARNGALYGDGRSTTHGSASYRRSASALTAGVVDSDGDVGFTVGCVSCTVIQSVVFISTGSEPIPSHRTGFSGSPLNGYQRNFAGWVFSAAGVSAGPRLLPSALRTASNGFVSLLAMVVIWA